MGPKKGRCPGEDGSLFAKMLITGQARHPGQGQGTATSEETGKTAKQEAGGKFSGPWDPLKGGVLGNGQWVFFFFAT